MRKFSLENPVFADILKHQAVHMDQAVCYCPEYLATRDMCRYPSRIAQIIRAVWLGELEASQYGADLVFSSLLSGLGERWQNFGENPNGYLFSQMLGRELFVKKGFYEKEVQALREKIAAHGVHIFPIEPSLSEHWQEAIPVTEDSDICLWIDDATYALCSESAFPLGDLLAELDIQVHKDLGPFFGGFEYFAAGLIDEGISHLRQMIEGLMAKGIRRVITLTGQSHYLFTTLCEAVGIPHGLEVISILEIVSEIETQKAYLYGGSFYTRFLGMSPLLNELTENTSECPIPNSCEFLPLVEGDKRIHRVTMWGMPAAAEFVPLAEGGEMYEKISTMAVADIQKAGGKELVACEPYAYQKFKELGLSPRYYLSRLR